MSDLLTTLVTIFQVAM